MRKLTWRLAAGGAVSTTWWVAFPFPPPGSDPLVDLVAFHSPTLLAWFRGWYYIGPAVAVVGGGMVAGAVWRVWIAGVGEAESLGGSLPSWPTAPTDPHPAVVIGEVHHPVRPKPAAEPRWLVIPERGLYTGVAIFGAVGSGKTAACMKPFAAQLFGWQAQDAERRAAGLVLEVKGDFCHQVRDILRVAEREEDYLEIGLDSRWQWNPLSDDALDSFSMAYTIASLMNQLFGRGKDPFWQVASTNLVRWVIELHRIHRQHWVTLRDIYWCGIDKELFAKRIAQVEDYVKGARVGVTVAGEVLLGKHGPALTAKWHWEPVADERLECTRTKELEALRKQHKKALEEQLQKLGVGFKWVRAASTEPQEAQDKVDAIRLWYEKDWKEIDKKLRTSIVEGISSFLGVFDDPAVAGVFCPPPPRERSEPSAEEERPAAMTASGGLRLRKPLPPLETLIERGTVLALNMPQGSNPALSRAIGVLLKMSWLQALLRRPARMAANPGWEPRPAVFLCDEYQQFASVGEDDPAGDEKAFALTRQSRLIPVVATQSISSLRSVLGQGEAWRALLQTLRTRIFLSLADDASADIASKLCGQVNRIKESWTVSEQIGRAHVSPLSGRAGGGTGGVGTAKNFREQREPVFHPRDFTVLGNFAAICQPYDGSRSLPARRVYLKPAHLPQDLPYWEAKAAGKL